MLFGITFVFRKTCERGGGGGRVVKNCLVKIRACVGKGSLSARWMTRLAPVRQYDHVAKSDLGTNFFWRRQNSPTIVKVFEDKFGQVVGKSFDFVLVSSKQRTLEIRATNWVAFKMFGQRVASLVNVICKAERFCRAQKGLSTCLAL